VKKIPRRYSGNWPGADVRRASKANMGSPKVNRRMFEWTSVAESERANSIMRARLFDNSKRPWGDAEAQKTGMRRRTACPSHLLSTLAKVNPRATRDARTGCVDCPAEQTGILGGGNGLR